MSQRPNFMLNEIMCPESAWLQQAQHPETKSFTHMGALLFNNQLDEFMEASFEKLPCLIRHSSSSQKQPPLETVFSKDMLLGISANNNKDEDAVSIPVMNNMSVRKYTDKHEREVFEFPDDATVDSKQLKYLFKSGYTVQFFQPQRFSNALHHICAGFEYHFGSLAGSSAYLTPPHTQGLAPHWDDVEVFIFQLEGTKLWHLWEGPYLPETPSDDLCRASSQYLQGDKEGEPAVQVLLQPGDILYLPRGTIHEALSQDSFSTHVTVSVFQKNNMKGLVEKMLPSLLQRVFDDASSPAFSSLRQGLPLNMPQTFGSFAALSSGSSSSSTEATRALTSSRKRLLASVKESLLALAAACEEGDVDDAADLFSDDFACHRLPPPEDEEDEGGEAFTLAQIDGARALLARDKKTLRTRAMLRLCDPRLLHHRVLDMGGTSVLFMGSCRDNDRMRHMGHPPLDPCGEMSGSGGEHEDEHEEEGGDSDEEEEEEEGGYSSENEDGGGEEDAMSWASFSLPARMCRVVQLLESRYDHDSASASASASGHKHCISYADLVSMSSEENYSETDIIDTLATLHSESLLTVFLANNDTPPPPVTAAKNKNKREHTEKSESKGKRKKNK